MASPKPRPLRLRLAIFAAAVVATLGLPGCKPYRIEYRDRPSFWASAGAEVPDRTVEPDGTVIVYRERPLAGALQEQSEKDEDDKPFLIREQLDDGRIVLRNLLPEHVLANLMTCLRKQEYELVWEQLLAEQTRSAYEARGGQEEFEAFFRQHRHDLAESVQRMSYGLLRHEIVIDNLGDGITRYRFHPSVAGQMKFKMLLMASEKSGLKLVVIQ